MKSETKQKFVKSVKDWKTWIFLVLPLIMIIAAAAIAGYCLYQKVYYSLPTIIVAALLIVVAFVLVSCKVVLKCLERRTKRNVIAACVLIVFTLAYVVIMAFGIAIYPEYESAQKVTDQLHQECLDAGDSEEGLHWDKFNAWHEAKKISNGLSNKISLLQQVASWVLLIGIVAMGLIQEKPNQDDENESKPVSKDSENEKANFE